MESADIGIIGLGVMGRNLALNLADHGFRVVVHNRTRERMYQFLDAEGRAAGIRGAEHLPALVEALSRPRKILLMVKAGAAVDAVIGQLLPLLAPDDILIDGGNSHYLDTERRVVELGESGVRFVGCGISGGEAGARHGPALMPGGDEGAWPEIRPLLQAIAAEVDGVPCCQWMGGGGAGHYVKMVHNGIEYGDMQLIAEAWHLQREGLGLSVAETAEVFARWNRGPLASYLVEITAHILAFRDEDGAPLVEKILDSAGQKGTGKWTGISALELGVPVSLVAEAVFSRFLSAERKQRLHAQARYGLPTGDWSGDRTAALADLEQALYASKLVSYAQGFMLLDRASREFDWNLALGDIALVWRGGCIIRSRFLDAIEAAYARDPDLENLLLDEFFVMALREAEPHWRGICEMGVALGVPLPAMTAALAFFDGYRRGRLPAAALIQAQRDYFGAHGYRRIDRDPDETFHTDWSRQP